MSKNAHRFHLSTKKYTIRFHDLTLPAKTDTGQNVSDFVTSINYILAQFFTAFRDMDIPKG